MRRGERGGDSGGPNRRELFGQVLGASIGAGLLLRSGLRAAEAGEQTGRVAARISGTRVGLSNDALRAEWEARPDGLTFLAVEDRAGRRTLDVGRGAFALWLEGGVLLDSSRMRIEAPVRVEELPGDPRAERLCERVPGRAVSARLSDADGRVAVEWRATLRQGARYLRQEVSVRAGASDVPLSRILLVDLEASGAAVIGTVKGSPVTAGTWFFGVEHPLADAAAGPACNAGSSDPFR